MTCRNCAGSPWIGGSSGVHAATSAYERGDTTLAAERGNNVDAALEWKDGTNLLRIGAFSARFSRFIALEATGNDVTVDGEDFPEYAFRSVRARPARVREAGIRTRPVRIGRRPAPFRGPIAWHA